jgi:hypothetical protein
MKILFNAFAKLVFISLVLTNELHKLLMNNKLLIFIQNGTINALFCFTTAPYQTTKLLPIRNPVTFTQE